MSAELPRIFYVTMDMQLLRYNLILPYVPHTQRGKLQGTAFASLCLRGGAKLRMATAFVRRTREANARRLDLSQYLSPTVHRTINCHADAIGVPPEFILYPLLTAVASCMGVNGSVRINSS